MVLKTDSVKAAIENVVADKLDYYKQLQIDVDVATIH